MESIAKVEKYSVAIAERKHYLDCVNFVGNEQK